MKQPRKTAIRERAKLFRGIGVFRGWRLGLPHRAIKRVPRDERHRITQAHIVIGDGYTMAFKNHVASKIPDDWYNDRAILSQFVGPF
jgi:hypothetical protein